METVINIITKRKIPQGLNRTMQYGNAIGTLDTVQYLEMFKSYYVVWKLFYTSSEKLNKFRLNRTMQYGN